MIQNVLFLSAQQYMPQMIGGMQSTTHQLTQALTDRGYDVSILAALMPNGWIGWRGRLLLKALRKKALCADQTRYEALSQKAISHSQGQAFDSHHQIGLWAEMIERAGRSSRG